MVSSGPGQLVAGVQEPAEHRASTWGEVADTRELGVEGDTQELGVAVVVQGILTLALGVAEGDTQELVAVEEPRTKIEPLVKAGVLEPRVKAEAVEPLVKVAVAGLRQNVGLLVGVEVVGPQVKVEVAGLRLEMGLIKLLVEVGVVEPRVKVEVAGLRLGMGLVELQVKVGVVELQYMSELRPVMEVGKKLEETEEYIEDFQEVAEAVEEL